MKIVGQLKFFTCAYAAVAPSELMLFAVLLPDFVDQPDCNPKAKLGTCRYMSASRADICKHVWDVHLRKTTKIFSYSELCRKLDPETRQQVKQMVLDLSDVHCLQRHDLGWKLITYPKDVLPLPEDLDSFHALPD